MFPGWRVRRHPEPLVSGVSPRRLGALTALAAGLVLTATHLVAEGPPTDGALVALAVAGIIVGIEGSAVLVCFAVLGRFLGLRR
jgi:hypothetical protein